MKLEDSTDTPSRTRPSISSQVSDYWRIWYYLLEAAGLSVQLVNARDVKNVPGRPKTDKLDAVWLAKLTEKGLLRPSFVPPTEIRRLRDYTRLREDLTHERTRYWQRLEKLLEDALIKVSVVASRLDTMSARDMIEALIAGERDPRRLAELARGKMRAKRAELITALDGRFDEHHAELARMLLAQIDALDAQINTLTGRIEELIAELPEAAALDHGGGEDTDITAPGAADRSDAGPQRARGAHQPTGSPPCRVDPVIEAECARLSAIERLDEITGVGEHNAQVIIAETGLDMTRFPTPGHLVAWAKLCPRTIQSGPVTRGGRTGKGNPYLKGALGQAAAAAARTDTFLGQRYRRIVKVRRITGRRRSWSTREMHAGRLGVGGAAHEDHPGLIGPHGVLHGEPADRVQPAVESACAARIVETTSARSPPRCSSHRRPVISRSRLARGPVRRPRIGCRGVTPGARSVRCARPA